MDPQLLVLIFLVAGVLLVFAEFVLPSGGLIAVICCCCFIASIWNAYKAWYVSNPAYWYTYCGAMMLVVPASVYGGLQILTRTPLGNRLLTKPPELSEVTPYLEESARLAKLIGRRGVATNLMTPGGIVNVDGQRLHAVSEGLMIEPNTPIEVVAVKGTRVVVRAAEDDVAATAPDAELLAEDAPADPFAEDEPA